MTVRVLAYPPVHDYVDRLHPSSARLVHRDQRWPDLPDLYDPRWLDAHAPDWDLAHLHFTWEQYPPDRVAKVLDSHRAAGTPIVWTAHDLRNPHTGRPDRDGAYLRLLAERADHVITLTSGAAQEVRERFGRRAQVIPHGPLLTAAGGRRWRERRAARLAGRAPSSSRRLLLHLRSPRANVDWRTPIRIASRLHQRGLAIELDVLILEDAAEVDEVRDAAGPGVRVHDHSPLTFDELVERLVAVDGLILAYRWGTHSGMVELATDLAVPVVAGDVGHLAEQAPLWTVPVRGGRLDPDALGGRIRQVTEGRRPPTVEVVVRAEMLRRFRRAHRAVYRRLTDAQGRRRGSR